MEEVQPLRKSYLINGRVYVSLWSWALQAVVWFFCVPHLASSGWHLEWESCLVGWVDSALASEQYKTRHISFEVLKQASILYTLTRQGNIVRSIETKQALLRCFRVCMGSTDANFSTSQNKQPNTSYLLYEQNNQTMFLSLHNLTKFD
jgi:hypothetical protein